eukprot:3839792-Amphidinium_carterae.1
MGPASTLAYHLRHLPGVLAGGVFTTALTVPLPILRPTTLSQCRQWCHSWRCVLRSQVAVSATQHRREYEDLRHGLDSELSVVYLRQLSANLTALQ